MEAIREIRKATNRKITIDLPERFKGRDVEIIILPLPSRHSPAADKLECLLLSESSLDDWDKDSEEKAWKNL